jgi:hypothetical protein
MDVLLKIMGATLGALVPLIFVMALRKGIDCAPLDEGTKARARRSLVALVALFTLSVWGCSLTGWISYHPGDEIPRVFLFLFAPVLVGVAALGSKTFREVLNHTPLETLVGTQAFRFAGAAFFLITYLGVLPNAFVTGAYGDVATATLATLATLNLRKGKAGVAASSLFWGFTVAGLVDLLCVAYSMLVYYPIWYHGAPSSAPIADFALVMIPAIAAPFALVLHVYAVRGFMLRAGSRSSQDASLIAASHD